MRANLVGWQWSGYGDFHADKKNLLLHIVTNPLFLSGNVCAVASVVAAFAFDPVCAVGVVVGVAASAVAIAAQGAGHKREAKPPIGFDGGSDVVSRILCEQWINFPRFVLSGRFARAWRAAR